MKMPQGKHLDAAVTSKYAIVHIALKVTEQRDSQAK